MAHLALLSSVLSLLAVPACAYITASAVRVSHPNVPEYMNLAEVLLWDPQGVNCALNGAATASSFFPTLPAASINNGVRTDLWHSGDGDRSPWVLIQLPGPCVVASIEVWGRLGGWTYRDIGDTVELLDVSGAAIFTAVIDAFTNVGGALTWRVTFPPPSPSVTFTATPTASSTPTPSRSATVSVTCTRSILSSASTTPASTTSQTPTRSQTPTLTPSKTSTPSSSQTPSRSPLTRIVATGPPIFWQNTFATLPGLIVPSGATLTLAGGVVRVLGAIVVNGTLTLDGVALYAGSLDATGASLTIGDAAASQLMVSGEFSCTSSIVAVRAASSLVVDGDALLSGGTFTMNGDSSWSLAGRLTATSSATVTLGLNVSMGGNVMVQGSTLNVLGAGMGQASTIAFGSSLLATGSLLSVGGRNAYTTVKVAGSATFFGTTTTIRGVVNIAAANFTLDEASTMNGNAQGERLGSMPYFGRLNDGGGYGSATSWADVTDPFDAATSSVLASVAVADSCSGRCSPLSGNAGASLFVNASGSMNISGRISMNGGDGQCVADSSNGYVYAHYYTNAGHGGIIQLIASILQMQGVLSVDGGGGGVGCWQVPRYLSSAGGGRISIRTQNNGDVTDFGTLSRGGSGYVETVGWGGTRVKGYPAAPGTVFLQLAGISELRVIGQPFSCSCSVRSANGMDVIPDPMVPDGITHVPLTPWGAVRLNRVVLANISAVAVYVPTATHSVLQVDIFAANSADMRAWKVTTEFGGNMGTSPYPPYSNEGQPGYPPSVQAPGPPLLTPTSFAPSIGNLLIGSPGSALSTTDEFFCQLACAQLGPPACTGYTYTAFAWPTGTNAAFNGLSTTTSNCQLCSNITALQPFPYARSGLLRSALPGVGSS